MKTILCYGDSNTWGAIPGGGRYPWEKRWPGILEKNLQGNAKVIEEAVWGRTTAWEDPFYAQRNGAESLPLCLDSHAPIDLCIILLGTNDLKEYFHLSPFSISLGAEKLIRIAKSENFQVGKVLLVSPCHIVPTSDPTTSLQFPHGEKRARELAAYYRQAAERQGAVFFDAATVARSSAIDGIHLEEREVRNIADALTTVCKELLGLP